MAETKRKGDLGEVIIMADIMKRGYKVAIPYGEDWRFDLIIERNNKLEKIQCKYTESDGDVIEARCRCTNNWVNTVYTEINIDWLVIYDKTTDKCYYIPSSILGEGRATVNLRINPSKNGQIKNVNLAKDFLEY